MMCAARVPTFSSHFEWTESPQSLHVFPCLLSPHMDVYPPDLHSESGARLVSQGNGCYLAIPTLRGDGERRALEGVRLLRPFVV